jgi:hypothetical protein
MFLEVWIRVSLALMQALGVRGMAGERGTPGTSYALGSRPFRLLFLRELESALDQEVQCCLLSR